jgi:hypothetical protein
MSTPSDDLPEELALDAGNATNLSPRPGPPPGPLAPRSQPSTPDPTDRQPDLQPGAGRPLVEGPPMSVDDPLPAETINRIAGIGALAVAGLVALIVAIVVVLVVLGVTGHL